MTFASKQKKRPPGLLAAGVALVSAGAAYVLLTAISTAIAATTVVTPSSMDGWTVQQSGTASGMLVTGPATPPAGSGSMQLTVGSNGDSGVQVRNSSFSGTKLSDLTALTYSTYVTHNTGCQAPYIVLDVDNDGNGTVDDLLFFEPCYQNGSFSGATVPNQGNVTLNTWQQWNALTGGWWSLNAGNGGPPLTTLALYAASHSGATIVNSGTGSGGIRVDAGFGAPDWNNFSGNFDNVVIGAKGVNTTYNFEPSGVNPSSSSSSTSSTSSSSSNASLSSSSLSSSSSSTNMCAPTVSSNNLIGFWKFDEGSGSTTADSSGNGHTGTLQNSPTWTASGSTEISPNPHALAFNGTNQDVRISGTGGAFRFGGSGSSFTVSADIKTTTGNTGVLGNFSASSQRGWGLYLYGSNRVDFFAYGNQGHSDVSMPSNVNLLDGNWHTVTGVFARSGSSLTIRTYADGNLIGTNTTTVGNITSASDLLLGRYLGQPAFNGSLDNVRVYARALSASEVSNLATACRSSSSSSSSTSTGNSLSSTSNSSSSSMTSSSTSSSTSSTSSSLVSSSLSSISLTSSSSSSNMCTNTVSNANLVGMWKFDEGSGSVTADSSGNHHTGILENNPQWTASGATQFASDPHALMFNGTNQDVRVNGSGGAFDFGSGASFTVSAFVKTATGNTGILGNYSNAHRGWGLYIYSSNRVDFFAYGNQGINDVSIPSSNVNLLNNQWHNITGVFTRSGSSITIRSYVDGNLIGSSTATVGDITSGSALLLGRYLGQPAFNGSLDNVSVYARALSASEVANLAGGCMASSSSSSSTSSTSSISSSVLSSSSSSTAAGGVPTCGGLAATIYVNAQGKIVGGPDNGMYYGGMLPGTNGNDVIVGTSGADMILGGNGDDVICGGGGNDFINGGNGNDRIAGEAGNDYVAGGNGQDVMCGGSGNDVLFAENGNDRLDGGGGQDMLFGGAGQDVCAEGSVNLSCEQTQTTPLPDCASLVSGMTNASGTSSSSMSSTSSSSSPNI